MSESEREQEDGVHEEVHDELDPREEAAMQIMREICAKTGLAMDAELVEANPPYLVVELVGEDVAATFGRNGKTLDALQYLSNSIIKRQVGPDVRLLLDAEGYRARREAALTEKAHEYAAQVKEMQQECEFEPLPAHERRIIHNALSEEPGIRTYSEGEGEERRVIIAPAS
jgi:spoIIIJ-associated protein